MQTVLLNKIRNGGFKADIDHLASMGTQIRWNNIEGAEAGTVLLQAQTDGPPIHFHPVQTEEFLVRQGELKVYKKDKWITLKAGDTLRIPARTPHTYKNTSGLPVIFDFCITPKVRFREMIEAMDVYVRMGKIKGKDVKSLLYLCRVMHDYPDVTQSVKPPQKVVQCMAALSKLFFK